MIFFSLQYFFLYMAYNFHILRPKEVLNKKKKCFITSSKVYHILRFFNIFLKFEVYFCKRINNNNNNNNNNYNNSYIYLLIILL